MNSTPRITIIIADYHQSIADRMVEQATQEARQHHAEVTETIRVPGAYELPLAAKRAIAKRTADTLVILGYIEKGETLHGEVMGHVAHDALIRLQLEHGIPMGLGIIGPGATMEQARARTDATARGAVQAALRMVNNK